MERTINWLLMLPEPMCQSSGALLKSLELLYISTGMNGSKHNLICAVIYSVREA